MYVKLDYFTRKCTDVRKVFDNHMKKQTILQLDLCFVSRNAALMKSFQNIQVHMRYTCNRIPRNMRLRNRPRRAEFGLGIGYIEENAAH